jgi:predicted nuclease of restriction endonuclease-like (RecB) superfamily
MDKKYLDFITDLKQNIIQSRYIAARLANKEQLLLYFKTGKMLSEKIDAEKWGAKIMEQIAEDLQKQLPGLRGFSYTNLKKMRQFASEHSILLIDYQKDTFSPLSTGQLQGNSFWGITFSHHMLFLSKCKALEERFFYMEQAATQFWSVNLLKEQHHCRICCPKH